MMSIVFLLLPIPRAHICLRICTS